ncbi:hypothetical protein B0H17DRAFT_1042074 [Mycena rosella]|uniref:Uncharacterized protein n=1 Tax=Mycena rosella TaxID=1033263 RepID=A0AAD7E1L8_MYCRO|nr:hypothetical protein B0H17DRAFT_1042074 [Mycena rosella]
MSGAYATDYEKHLGLLRAHLSGDAGKPLPPSFVPPAGYWTSREKDAFFHALSVHSRLRPDLIAASVKSKNVLDVCAYIDALGDAAAARPLHASSFRSSLEGAMEVSDSWVHYEEEQASALKNLELEWEREAEEHRRSMSLVDRFQDGNAYWTWKEQQEGQWEKQDTLKQLTSTHLLLMDWQIRNPDRDPRGTEPIETEPSSAQPPTSRFHDALIDPALLALSASEPSLPLQYLLSQGHTIPDPGPSRTPEPSLNPDTLLHAVPSSPIPNGDQPPSDLSPKSRRRLAKRLHMRKKRAEAMGIEPIMTAAKIAPGRKKTRVRVPKPRAKKYKKHKFKTLDQERDDVAEGSQHDAEEESQLDGSREASPYSYNPGGVVRRQKILSAFKDVGIDGNMLTQSGFDIFNVSGIAKLMRLFHGAYTGPGERSIASSISFDTIKLLHGILLDFTSTAVHRAISMREQEIILKRSIKVWRLGNEDEITAGNVLDALQLHGLNSQSLLTDFPRVKADPPPEPSENDDRSEPRFEEDISMFPARLPIHRELAPLFVIPPRRPENTSLLPAETDADELLFELDDESKLDVMDRQLEAQYEKELWQASKAE